MLIFFIVSPWIYVVCQDNTKRFVFNSFLVSVLYQSLGTGKFVLILVFRIYNKIGLMVNSIIYVLF